MNWINKTSIIGASVILLAVGATELYHRCRFGDFFGYGLHTDVILGNSDIGNNDMYYARLWNVSFKPFQIEGCVSPSGDDGGVPRSVVYRWDVQKREPSSQHWVSLRGADTWVMSPFGGSWYGGSWLQDRCLPATTQIRPLQSRKVAWVYRDWVTNGDAIRIAIHTSVRVAPENQRIIYTDLFVVAPHQVKNP